MRAANDLRNLPRELQEKVFKMFPHLAPQNRAADKAANMERPARNEPLGKKACPKTDTRYHLHFHSQRGSRCDREAVSHKAAIDGLVRAGVLPDDTDQIIEDITCSQAVARPDLTTIEIYEVLKQETNGGLKK